MLGRDVAIKLLSPDADAVTRQRFVREARSAARLHHPNAVAVYDTGEADGQPYLVMELVRGRTLADVLAEDGPLDPEEAVAITAGVLAGLEAAHRAGMVHRDVKPGNVLLPDEGGVKLSDSGIAKALNEESGEVTAVGVLMGTPTYLAPELLVGEPPSPASDVYGVGCLLYAELTGAPPFTRGDAMAIAYAHRHEPAPPIASHRPDVPDDLATVGARALAKNPSERYASAAAMRTALLEGPAAVAAAEDAAMVAGPVAGERDRTRVLDGTDAPTRAIGAGATAPAAGGAVAAGRASVAGGGPAAAPAAATSPTRDRGPWSGIVVLLAVLLLAVALWVLLRDDAPGEEPPLDEQQEVEEAPDAPVDDAPDDTPAEPDDTSTQEPGEPVEADAPADETEDPADEPAPDAPEEHDGQPPPEEHVEAEDDGTVEEEASDEDLDGADGGEAA